MKIRVTLMTENDKHLNLSKEEIEKHAMDGWNVVCKLYSNSNEKVTIEKCEVVEM